MIGEGTRVNTPYAGENRPAPDTPTLAALVLPENSGTNRNSDRDHHEYECEDEWHTLMSARNAVGQLASEGITGNPR